MIWPWSKPKEATLPRGLMYESDALKAMIADNPGYDENTVYQVYDRGPFIGLKWREMQKIYAKTRKWGLFIPEVRDCDKYTRAAAAEVNMIWAEMGGRKPLAHGTLAGLVPQDSGSLTAPINNGYHSLCWFMDDNGDLYLYGAQQRSVKDRSEVLKIQKISSITVGG